MGGKTTARGARVGLDCGMADETIWVVWRQDDNGNRYEVARHATREAAEAQAAELEARGHKQVYWVAKR
ncbi:hypothetical protein AB0M47_14145 [Hamadaea sp. NPDC051192]|uniref:hypothetical protein n=1 Tax=Hamadaea sp. NPDC051192 TaxID=3154940 RepID=UPI00342215A9